MRKYLRCRYGHVFNRLANGQILSACPECESAEVKDVPQVVVDSIEQWSVHKKLEQGSVMYRLKYDGLMDCYYFTWAGMYVGVEDDGYIHT